MSDADIIPKGAKVTITITSHGQGLKQWVETAPKALHIIRVKQLAKARYCRDRWHNEPGDKHFDAATGRDPSDYGVTVHWTRPIILIDEPTR